MGGGRGAGVSQGSTLPHPKAEGLLRADPIAWSTTEGAPEETQRRKAKGEARG